MQKREVCALRRRKQFNGARALPARPMDCFLPKHPADVSPSFSSLALTNQKIKAAKAAFIFWSERRDSPGGSAAGTHASAKTTHWVVFFRNIPRMFLPPFRVSLFTNQKIKTAKAVIIFWSERRDSNSRHPAPKAGALPAALRPDYTICPDICRECRFFSAAETVYHMRFGLTSAFFPL